MSPSDCAKYAVEVLSQGEWECWSYHYAKENAQRVAAAQVLPSRIYGNPPLFDQIVWESEPVQSNPPPGIRIRQGGAPMRIRTFEYLIEYEGGADDNLPAIGDVLANAGLEGWRLVSSERGRLIFEREIL